MAHPSKSPNWDPARYGSTPSGKGGTLYACTAALSRAVYPENLFLSPCLGVGVRLRDLLSKLIWDPSEDVSEVEIRYVDRSKDPRGRTVSRIASVSGRDIVELGPGYLVVEREGGRSSIPFHRVTEVIDGLGRTRWSRGGEEGSRD